MSDRTIERLPERRLIVQAVTHCELAAMGGCYGEIARHEIVRRSQYSESQYMAELVIGLCVPHHELDLYRLAAERLGIRIPRWVFDRDGDKAIAEAAALRSVVGGGVPYWWT